MADANRPEGHIARSIRLSFAPTIIQRPQAAISRPIGHTYTGAATSLRRAAARTAATHPPLMGPAERPLIARRAAPRILGAAFHDELQGRRKRLPFAAAEEDRLRRAVAEARYFWFWQAGQGPSMILRARSLAKPTPAHSTCEGVMSIWSNRPVSDRGTGPCLALHCAILIVHALVMYSSFMLFFLSNFYWRNLVSTLLYFIPQLQSGTLASYYGYISYTPSHSLISSSLLDRHRLKVAFCLSHLIHAHSHRHFTYIPSSASTVPQSKGYLRIC